MCPRLQPIDFDLNSYTPPGAAWPISYSDLQPYYGQAERSLRVRGGKVTKYHPPRDSDYPIPPDRDLSALASYLAGRTSISRTHRAGFGPCSDWQSSGSCSPSSPRRTSPAQVAYGSFIGAAPALFAAALMYVAPHQREIRIAAFAFAFPVLANALIGAGILFVANVLSANFSLPWDRVSPASRRASATSHGSFRSWRCTKSRSTSGQCATA